MTEGLFVISVMVISVMVTITCIILSYLLGYRKGKIDTETAWGPMMATNVDLATRAGIIAANKKIKEYVKEFSERITKSYEETDKMLDKEKEKK